MELSSFHSDSKCNSNFSIKMILGEDAESGSNNVATPSWLCCTRYRPPRLPRSASSTACRVRRSSRHARVPFSAAQAAALEAAYSRAPYLAPPALRALAAALQLRDDRIKIWFQNRRARERREKCNTITPPQAVTLPPNRPWFPHSYARLSETQNCRELEHSTNSTSQQYQTSIATNSLRPGTLIQIEDELEERCDSPLDVES